MMKSEYYVDNMDLTGKNVVCRCDFNVPTKNGVIMDDFRIRSAIPTIQTILSKKPNYVLIVAHFGRPKPGADNTQYSLQFLKPVLDKYLNTSVQFLENGISDQTLYELQHTTSADEPMIYLLENIRFHTEETAFDTTDDTNPVVSLYKEMGDVFICDAFGCVHRSHMSITCGKRFQKSYGYGHLIKKEVDELSILTSSTNNEKLLCIIGGNKIADKLPLIDSLKTVPNSTIYIAGGLAKNYTGSNTDGVTNVQTMTDGIGNTEVNMTAYPIPDIFNSEYNAYDIGEHSLTTLMRLANSAEIIFWNGTLGIIEHEIYKAGTVSLMTYLSRQTCKRVIIGGGETASMVPSDSLSHFYVSTGGGALLEFIENMILYNKLIVGLDIYA
jgi:phosphoglycerate kinase